MKKWVEGYTIAEVVLALMAIGMVFSVILPGFYLTNILENQVKVNRDDTSKIRYLELYFKKQIYQSDIIYVKGDKVFLRDLVLIEEDPPKYYYDNYTLKNDIIRQYKYNKEGEKMTFIGQGGASQLEAGFKEFSIRISPEDEGIIVITYQLSNEKEERKHELIIEHGKKVQKIME